MSPRRGRGSHCSRLGDSRHRWIEDEAFEHGHQLELELGEVRRRRRRRRRQTAAGDDAVELKLRHRQTVPWVPLEPAQVSLEAYRFESMSSPTGSVETITFARFSECNSVIVSL